LSNKTQIDSSESFEESTLTKMKNARDFLDSESIQYLIKETELSKDFIKSNDISLTQRKN
jgi:hypothetical protein